MESRDLSQKDISENSSIFLYPEYGLNLSQNVIFYFFSQTLLTQKHSMKICSLLLGKSKDIDKQSDK